jgi:hypothetical protein
MLNTGRISTLIVLVGLLTVAGAAGLGNGGEPQLRNWSAPPFWSPHVEGARTGANAVSRTSPTANSAEISVPPMYAFVSVPPCRQYNSNTAGGPISSGATVPVVLTGAPCNIPPSAAAVSANFAVFGITGATGNGVVKVNPTGSPAAIQALVNYPPNQSQIDNASVVPLGAGGSIDVGVFQGGGSAGLIVDVNGYYALQTLVNTVNGLSGYLTLSGGTGVGITPSGNTLTFAVPAGSLTADRIASGQVVKDVNGLFDSVSLAAGSNISITPSGNMLTIAASVPTSVPGYELKTQSFNNTIPLHGFAQHSLICSDNKRILGGGAYTNNTAYIIQSVQYYRNFPTNADAIFVTTMSLCDPGWYAGCSPVPVTTTYLWITCSN